MDLKLEWSYGDVYLVLELMAGLGDVALSLEDIVELQLRGGSAHWAGKAFERMWHHSKRSEVLKDLMDHAARLYGPSWRDTLLKQKCGNICCTNKGCNRFTADGSACDVCFAESFKG